MQVLSRTFVIDVDWRGSKGADRQVISVMYLNSGTFVVSSCTIATRGSYHEQETCAAIDND